MDAIVRALLSRAMSRARVTPVAIQVRRTSRDPRYQGRILAVTKATYTLVRIIGQVDRVKPVR